MAAAPSFLSVCELVAAYAERRVSPVEATQAALDAIARHDPCLNAFRLVDHDAALAAARASEARWQRNEPLGGPGTEVGVVR